VTGYWSIDVPIGPKEVDEDMAFLGQIDMPEGVVIWSAEVVVHGRRWEWRRVEVQGEPYRPMKVAR
jgi:hypothetical protein